MAYIPSSSSVVAFQSDPNKLVATVSVVGNVFVGGSILTAQANQSVSGTVQAQLQSTNASIITVGGGTTGNSSVTAYQGGAWSTSVTGGYVNVIGSVATVPSPGSVSGVGVFQVNMPSPSVIAYQAAGSVLAVSGSFSGGNSSVQVVGTMPPQSVSGVGIFNVNVPTPSFISYQLAGSVMAVAATVNTGNSSVQLLGSNAIIGSVTALQGTNPWIVNVPTPSYISYQLAGSVLAVSGTFVGGNSSVQVVGIMPPQSVSGVGLFNVNPTGNGSVLVVQNDPTKLVGTMSVMGTLSVLGTVPVTQATASNPWVIGSIVGTYSEDAGHTNADKGIFTLGVRNDTVASFASADLDYTPQALDSAGRTIVKPFAPDASSVFGTGSVNGAASVILIGAPGAGLRNYITDVMVSNTGSVSTLITFTAGGGSILGRTIAPAGGGSNIIGMASPMVTQVNSPFNFDSGTASSVVYGAAYGYRAP